MKTLPPKIRRRSCVILYGVSYTSLWDLLASNTRPSKEAASLVHVERRAIPANVRCIPPPVATAAIWRHSCRTSVSLEAIALTLMASRILRRNTMYSTGSQPYWPGIWPSLDFGAWPVLSTTLQTNKGPKYGPRVGHETACCLR